MTPEIQEQLTIAQAPFTASMEAMGKIPALVDEAEAKAKAEGQKIGEEIGYEQGLKDAGQAGGSDKVYSDAQMNEFIAPLKEEIATLKAEKEQLQIKVTEQVAVIEAQEPELVDLRAKVETAEADKAEAVLAKQKEIMAAYKDSKVDDEAFEAKFGG